MRSQGGIRFQTSFPRLVPDPGAGCSRVTHPFATFAPEGALVRLACLIHAASVHSEPGSNSPLQKDMRRRGGKPPRPRLFHQFAFYRDNRSVLRCSVSKEPAALFGRRVFKIARFSPSASRQVEKSGFPRVFSTAGRGRGGTFAAIGAVGNGAAWSFRNLQLYYIICIKNKTAW